MLFLFSLIFCGVSLAVIRLHASPTVGLLHNLRIVNDQNDGAPVCDQIVHHTGKPHSVGRVQADGWHVQHIENAGGAVTVTARASCTR